MISITITIIAITCLVSFAALSNQKLLDDLIMYPPAITNRKQYYRLLTSGFIHADFMHLLFNMFTLYFFGELIEEVFVTWTGSKLVFPLFYLSAIIISDIPSYFKNKDNYHYRSLGASGAVNAVLFVFVLLAPWEMLQVWFIPMPAIVFAAIYVAYSIYAERRGRDNINHSAHLWGAAYGILFTVLLKPGVLQSFLEKITNPSF